MAYRDSMEPFRRGLYYVDKEVGMPALIFPVKFSAKFFLVI